eukprot:329785_1
MKITQYPTTAPTTIKPVNVLKKYTKWIMIITAVLIVIVILCQLHAIHDLNDDPPSIAPIGQISIYISDLLEEPIVLDANQDYFFEQTRGGDARRTHATIVSLRVSINVHLQEPYPPPQTPLFNKTHLNMTMTFQDILDNQVVRRIRVEGAPKMLTHSNGSYTFRMEHAQTIQTDQATSASFSAYVQIDNTHPVIIDFWFYSPKQPDAWKGCNHVILHKNSGWSGRHISVDRRDLVPDRILHTIRTKKTLYPYFVNYVSFGEGACDWGGPSQDYLERMMPNAFKAIGSTAFKEHGLVLHTTPLRDMQTVIGAMAMCLYRDGMGMGQGYVMSCPLSVDILHRVYFKVALSSHLPEEERRDFRKAALEELFIDRLGIVIGWNETAVDEMSNADFKKSYGFGVFDKVSDIDAYYDAYFAQFCTELGRTLHRLGWSFLNVPVVDDFVQSLYKNKLNADILIDVVINKIPWSGAIDTIGQYKKYFQDWINIDKNQNTSKIDELAAFWTGSKLVYPGEKAEIHIVDEFGGAYDNYTWFKAETCFHKLLIKSGIDKYERFSDVLDASIKDDGAGFNMI